MYVCMYVRMHAAETLIRVQNPKKEHTNEKNKDIKMPSHSKNYTAYVEPCR